MPDTTPTRRQRAALLRGEGKTLAEIGSDLGVSSERARQLLLPRPVRACVTCGGALAPNQKKYCRPECAPRVWRRRSGRPRGRPRKEPKPPQRRET